MEVQVDEEDIRRLENCYVGQAKCPEIISTLQDTFAMEGYFLAKVTPMGGNLVLLPSGDEEELKHLVVEGHEWLAQWFTDVRPWTPEEVATKRFTWLRCQGVPLHIWKCNFFETVACMFRKFVSLNGSTIKKSRLDVAKILIMTPLQENINKVLKIKVKTKLFHIRISEEVGVDNTFSLRSDFSLCRTDDSNAECWPEGSNSLVEPSFGPKWRELGLTINFGPIEGTECNHSMEQHKEMAQNQEVDKGEEKVPDGKSSQEGDYNNGNKDSNCKAIPVLAGKAKSNDDYSIEEERRTRPFWEGLASDNEILQSRAERLAKQRKMEKKKVKLRKVTTRRKA
ncbi:hypothetical protein SLEP1_g11645 [Rubroshorea leprosula]|nr:hypothetical protein SLEP1_g11645 [Rubroshorea leprosula]